jgi:hypothetical protein
MYRLLTVLKSLAFRGWKSSTPHVRGSDAPDAPFFIFYDLDGVLADYAGGARKLGFSEGELWKAQHIRGFYRNLKPIRQSIEMVKVLENFYPGSTRFLTSSPEESLTAAGEKVAWLFDIFEPKIVKRRYIITGDKGSCGQPCDILIDDHLDWARCKKFPGLKIQFDGPHQWGTILETIHEHAAKHIHGPLR